LFGYSLDNTSTTFQVRNSKYKDTEMLKILTVNYMLPGNIN
jgi:hypothetical protein